MCILSSSGGMNIFTLCRSSRELGVGIGGISKGSSLYLFLFILETQVRVKGYQMEALLLCVLERTGEDLVGPFNLLFVFC